MCGDKGSSSGKRKYVEYRNKSVGDVSYANNVSVLKEWETGAHRTWSWGNSPSDQGLLVHPYVCSYGGPIQVPFFDLFRERNFLSLSATVRSSCIYCLAVVRQWPMHLMKLACWQLSRQSSIFLRWLSSANKLEWNSYYLSKTWWIVRHQTLWFSLSRRLTTCSWSIFSLVPLRVVITRISGSLMCRLSFRNYRSAQTASCHCYHNKLFLSRIISAGTWWR